jgi:hypothetical protein
MIKKWIEFINEEFIDNSESLVDVKMQELYDLIQSISDENGQNLIYEWKNDNDHELIVNFSKEDLQLRWEFDIDDLHIKKFAGENLDFEREVESVDEGLDIIEKDIQMILNISERVKAQRYKGRKIPGKYLTKNPGKMKKEIDTFRGKKEYKKDWDADYSSGKGGVGKRVKTKKSAATKAYQRMFGDK